MVTIRTIIITYTSVVCMLANWLAGCRVPGANTSNAIFSESHEYRELISLWAVLKSNSLFDVAVDRQPASAHCQTLLLSLTLYCVVTSDQMWITTQQYKRQLHLQYILTTDGIHVH